jgi:signal transduction histidine kinase
MLRPIIDITTSASSITASKLHSERLPVQNKKDELGKLSITINHLLDRLEKSFQDQKQFVDDASHELRTPLTILKGTIEIMQMKSEIDPKELLSIHEEVDSLISLTNKLLLLAQSDLEKLKLQSKTINLHHLIEKVIDQFDPLLAKHAITLTLQSEEEVVLNGDEELLAFPIPKNLFHLYNLSLNYTNSTPVHLLSPPLPDSYEYIVTFPRVNQQLRVLEDGYRLVKLRTRFRYRSNAPDMDQ